MRLHVDLLGYVHVVWGIFGLLAGASLGVLAAGTNVAAMELGSVGAGERAAVVILLLCGGVIGGFGAAMLVVGRALHRRRGAARRAALALAVPNLVVVPFGTALAIYTFWVLQNDDARRQFGASGAASGGPRREPV